MSSDNVSTTAPEGRKSTKPIMEKRRRARINACLAELKSLLMDVIKAEGARHSKMEKADILEMTVRHLRQLQRLSISGVRTQETTTQSKYRMGYVECINEVGRFLGSLEVEEVDLRTKIIDHLANCVAGAKLDQAETEVPTSTVFSHAPAVIRPRPEKPSASLINRADIVSASSSIVALNVPQIMKPDSTEEFKTAASTQCMPVINLYAPSIYRTSALASPEIPSGHITSLKPGDVSKVPTNFTTENETQRTSFSNVNKPFTCDIQPKPVLVSQPDMNINLIGTSSATTISPITPAQIFGGLQLVPKQLPSGEIVFIVPTNIMPTTQSPSYIIPILSPNTSPSTLTTASSQTTEQSTRSSSVSNVIPTVGFKPISVTSVTPIVPAQSFNSSFSVCDTKTVIPTCAETSPVLQYVCDSRQNDLMKLKTFEKSSSNQNTFALSDMRSCVPQYFMPTKYTSIVTPAPSSRANVREQSKSPPIPKQTANNPNFNERLMHPTHLISEHLAPKPSVIIPPSREPIICQDPQFSEHLVLNLAMRNRTRADHDGSSRSNFQEDDESMWRPW